MTESGFDPLFGADPTEIPLSAAPLVTVLAQVRFPEIISIRQKSFIAEFQELVRADYPLMRDEHIKAFHINEDGVQTSVAEDSVWRFIDEKQTTRLTLASSFISLETKKYESRADFVEKLGKVVESASKAIRPSHVIRIGMRYVDQVDLPNGKVLDGMLRGEMLGLAGSSIRKEILHATSEVVFKVKEGHMLARWGLLPPRGTHDPDVMPPTKNSSWYLDIDTFAGYENLPIRFNPEAIRTTARALAARSYSFFRWAVTEQFLREYGGQ